jgi:hypothetical protein
MPEVQLTLTDDECDYLTHLLEDVLKQTRIEEHRTRTLTYRQEVVHREEVITALLGKLGRPGE